jgi:Flp pilus assembly pilin Flp
VRKRKKKKAGQAAVEYILILAMVVTVIIWGFGYIKCSLHKVWINMACDVLYPYPSKVAGEQAYCQPITDCFDL